MRLRPVPSEIDAGSERDARPLQNLATECFAVGCKPGAVGVDEKSAGRRNRNRETQLTQRRDQKVAARLEFYPTLLENPESVRQKAGQCRALRKRRRRDVQ